MSNPIAILDCRFDYSTMPAATAGALRAQAGRVRKINKTVMASILDAGKELIDAKKKLPHGSFQDWVEAECGFSIRTAENYIRATHFAEGKNATVANLSPGVVYKIAAPRAPKEIVETVLKRVSRGQQVSEQSVSEAIRKFQEERKRAAEEARMSPKRRAKKAAEKAKWKAVREQHRIHEEAILRTAADSIRDRLDTETLEFIVKTLTATEDPWGVLLLLEDYLEASRTSPAEVA